MSHGTIDDVVYQNMNLLQDILEKQGRIVRLEQQVYSQLEAELRVATEAADDAASDKANLLDVDLDAASELDPEEDNISATIWTRRDASPGPATAQKRRRSPRRERAPSESKLTVLEKEQKPWPSPTDEDSSSSYTSSWAKDLSPMSPPSNSPSSSSAGNNQGDLASWHTPLKGEPRQCDALLMKGPCSGWNPCGGCLAQLRWMAEEDSSSS